MAPRKPLTREEAFAIAFQLVLDRRTRNKGTVTVHKAVTPYRISKRAYQGGRD